MNKLSVYVGKDSFTFEGTSDLSVDIVHYQDHDLLSIKENEQILAIFREWTFWRNEDLATTLTRDCGEFAEVEIFEGQVRIARVCINKEAPNAIAFFEDVLNSDFIKQRLEGKTLLRNGI